MLFNCRWHIKHYARTERRKRQRRNCISGPNGTFRLGGEAPTETKNAGSQRNKGQRRSEWKWLPHIPTLPPCEEA